MKNKNKTKLENNSILSNVKTASKSMNSSKINHNIAIAILIFFSLAIFVNAGDVVVEEGYLTADNVSVGGTIRGIFNWIINQESLNYLTFNGTELIFNENFLNSTIDSRVNNEYSYNQTEPANNYTDIINQTNYNWITFTFMKISDLILQYYNKTDIDSFNSSWSSTYNETYEKYAYNMSLGINGTNIVLNSLDVKENSYISKDLMVNDSALYVNSSGGYVMINPYKEFVDTNMEFTVIGNTMLNDSNGGPTNYPLDLRSTANQILFTEEDTGQQFEIITPFSTFRIRDKSSGTLELFRINSGGGFEFLNSGVCIDDDSICTPPSAGNLAIVDGSVCIDDDNSCTPNATQGSLKAVNILANGHSDVAEMIEVTDQNIEGTDVVCVDVNNPIKVTYCNGAYDTAVVGIISSMNASLIANIGCGGHNTIPMYDENNLLIGYEDDPTACNTFRPIALKGNVPVKVDCSTPINIGDLLVTASEEGYAQSINSFTPTSWQQVWSHLGSPFAKALESCDEGTGTIRAWIM